MRGVRSLDRKVYSLLHEFRFTLREFIRNSDKRARKQGVTSQQYQILLAIKAAKNGWVSVTAVAETLLITHHAAVGLVKRGKLSGLLRTARSREDARLTQIFLTKKGEKIVSELATQNYKELSPLCASLKDLFPSECG